MPVFDPLVVPRAETGKEEPQSGSSLATSIEVFQYFLVNGTVSFVRPGRMQSQCKC